VQRKPVKLSELISDAYVLLNVLSPKECCAYIDEFERRARLTEEIESLDWKRNGNGETYRMNDRVASQSPDLADRLWRRIAPHLPDLRIDVTDELIERKMIEYSGTALSHGMNRGLWEPAYLNPLLRFCKYNAGGLFGAHRDGIYIHTTTKRSFYTVMLYLNDAFDGGHTNFLTGTNENSVTGIAYSLKPKPGSCLVFMQDMLHEGTQLTSGVKYILRTDLMFECRSAVQPESSKEDQAMELIRMAQEYERCANGIEAVECYRRAFRLCPELEQKLGY